MVKSKRTRAVRNNRLFRVNYENRNNASFEAYQHDIGHIYAETDKQRDVTDILLNVVRHTSAVAESVRRTHYGTIPRNFSDVIVWLLSLVAKLHADLEGADRIFTSKIVISEAILRKYPFACPVCFGLGIRKNFKEIEDLRKPFGARQIKTLLDQLPLIETVTPCRCLSEPISATEDRKESKRQEERERKENIDARVTAVRLAYADRLLRQKMCPKTIREFDQMFEGIYSSNVRSQHLSDIAFHLQEEVGEMADAMRQIYTFNTKNYPRPGRSLLAKRVAALEEELADVFSWIFSLLFKMRETFDTVQDYSRELYDKEIGVTAGELTLAEFVWLKYGDKVADHLRCGDLCHESRCQCPWLVARTEDRVSEILARP